MLSLTPHRLRKHADYQRVYQTGRKQFSKQIAYFHSLRPPLGQDGTARRSDTPGPRIGLTVPKALGKAVDRNRIKRRMREAVRHALPLITAPVDVILHPRRSVLTLEFAQLKHEVAQILRSVQSAIDNPKPEPSKPHSSGPHSAVPHNAVPHNPRPRSPRSSRPNTSAAPKSQP